MEDDDDELVSALLSPSRSRKGDNLANNVSDEESDFNIVGGFKFTNRMRYSSSEIEPSRLNLSASDLGDSEN